MELTGGGIALGVGGVPARQGAVEVARADGVELVGELVGAEPALDDGERPPGVADDVGVGGEVEAGVHRARAGLPRPGRRRPPADRTYRLRYHSARPPRRRTPCTIPLPRNQW